MIYTNRGLQISLAVLELLRNADACDGYDIGVGTFTNCRECGLTFTLYSFQSGGDTKYLAKPFTWCVYEHRNSDQIIINGCEGYAGFNGTLPYKSDSKSDYLAALPYGQYSEAADKLTLMIVDKALSVNLREVA